MATSSSDVAVRKRDRWRELLRRWQASGLSQAAFCRRRGVPVQKFLWWKRRLSSEGAASGASFVPVQVMAGSSAGELELTLHGGRLLRFGPDVELTRLAGIVAALEAIRPEGAAC